MKKLFKSFVALFLVGSLVACGQSATSTATESNTGSATETSEAAPASNEAPRKIGVATVHEGETWEIQKKYFTEELGPKLNMEFMFSEKLSDANGLVDFMDQAYAAGCVGLINLVTQNDAVAQGARKAEEWGMWFTTQNSALNDDVKALSHNLGHCGAGALEFGEAYKTALKDLIGDGEPHSIVIFSGAAVGGAIGQGAASHYYSVEGMLKAFEETYDLKFEKSIDEIINTQDPGPVATGRDDVNIYIYPGRDPSAALPTIQAQLQTGNYDTFAAVFSYAAFTTAIDEVEKSLNKDVRIIGTASIEAQTETGFNTKDSFGNSILNAAIINPLNVANAVNAIEIYQGLAGNGETVKDGGNAVLLGVSPWACMNAETYAGIGKLDTGHDTYVINSDDLDKYIGSISSSDLANLLKEVSDVNAVISKKVK